MKVKIIRSILGEDKTDWMVGEIHDATDQFARDIIGTRAAVLAPNEPEPAPEPLTTASLAPKGGKK